MEQELCILTEIDKRREAEDAALAARLHEKLSRIGQEGGHHCRILGIRPAGRSGGRITFKVRMAHGPTADESASLDFYHDVRLGGGLDGTYPCSMGEGAARELAAPSPGGPPLSKDPYRPAYERLPNP